MSNHGQIVFAHLEKLSEPLYEDIFTVSNYEIVTANSRLALMVCIYLAKHGDDTYYSTL